MTDNKLYVSELYADVLEMMGGSPPCLYDGTPPSITKQELLVELNELSNYHYLCGAYWMFTKLFPNQTHTAYRLARAKNREEMLTILKQEDYCD